MAIPRFYGLWLKNRKFYNVILTTLGGLKVSSLSLDLNSLIHLAAAKSFGYDKNLTNTEIVDINNQTNEVRFNMFKEKFKTMLTNIILTIRPLDTLVLAVDGVAPMAKIQQQRQRRYKSKYHAFFDSNCISPGTPFMDIVDKIIEELIKSGRPDFPDVIYSSHMTKGEGEHKIMDYFRNGKIRDNIKHGTVHVVYGADADLIMLTLGLEVNNIFLFRDNSGQQSGGFAEYVNIDQLRHAISTMLPVSDFITILMLMGNDFVPKNPSLHDIDKIDLLINVYNKNKLPLVYEGKLLVDNFLSFIRLLAKEEPELLAVRSRQQGTDKYITSEMLVRASTTGNFDFAAYRDLWYNNELGSRYNPAFSFNVNTDNIKAMTRDYIKIIAWSIYYYKYGTSASNTNFYYPWYHAPLFLDISKLRDVDVKDIYVPIDISYGPFEQLTAIIPPTSSTVVPPEVASAYYNQNLQHLFPITFLIEIDGQRNEEEGVALIPFANMNLIKKQFSQYPLNNRPDLIVPHAGTIRPHWQPPVLPVITGQLGGTGHTAPKMTKMTKMTKSLKATKMPKGTKLPTASIPQYQPKSIPLVTNTQNLNVPYAQTRLLM